MSDPKTHHRDIEFNDSSLCEMEIERWPEMRGPDWRALPWRKRLAWRIRNFANKIDAQLTYAINGHFPADTSQDDLWDAMAFGLAASRRYLLDLDRDRKGKGE
jgi:hypothetical protein